MADQGLFISVNGTGVPDPFGPGFSGDIGRSFANPWNDIFAQFWGDRFRNKFYWQPIGYPAAVIPMGSSVKIGIDAVVQQVLMRPRGVKKVMSGYSQGAIVIGEVWRDEVLNPSGRLYEYQDDFVGIVNFGDPMRCPGIANGNVVANMPMPNKDDGQTTGGIAGPGCLTSDQTPPFYLSCALDGDMYACCPIGDNPWQKESEVGAIETMIYNLILDPGFDDVIAIATKVVEVFQKPLELVVPLVQAIWNAGSFLFQGINAPHWKYDPFIPAMTDWVNSRI